MTTVEVTVNDGDNTYTGSFTFSLYDYAVAVVAGSNTAEEKTLAKDMLSYAKAAYTYWNKTSDKLDAIVALLGKDYDAANTADMSKANGAVTPENTGFTGVTLFLGEAPSYRFYYEGTAPSYTFNVGERTVNATSGSDAKGTYLELKLFAYEMLLDVTFGDYTYSAYAYYAWARSNTMTAEMALVERLINYCESASAFKASANAN